jgi:hypothetical protein
LDELSIESMFGINAGIVWKALNDNGPFTIESLVETTSLSREEVFGALGWLGRENKICIEMQRKARGRAARVFSLRQSEI